MVAANNELTRNAETIRRRTQPLVNNLYQGMTLDAATGLYYERFRDYSPTLGRWMIASHMSVRRCGVRAWRRLRCPVGN